MRKHIIMCGVFSVLFIGCNVWLRLPLMDWINSTFLIGIIALSASVLIRIWKTGFLSLFISGFRIIGHTVIPRTRSAERTDNLIKNDYKFITWKSEMSNWILYSFTNLAIISMAISFISLFIYYA